MSEETEAVEVDGVEIPKAVYNKIIGSARQGARAEVLESEKQRLLSEFGALLEGAKEGAKPKELISELAGKVGSMSEQLAELQAKNQNHTETVQQSDLDREMELTKIKAEYEQRLNDERRAIKASGIQSELLGMALSNGLKENYKDMVLSEFGKRYKIEDGEKLLFRDQKEDVLVYEGDQPAGIGEIEKRIRSEFPELFKQTIAGAGTKKPSSTPVSTEAQGSDAYSAILAGVQELNH